MGSEENAPLGGGAATGAEADERAGGARRSVGLIFGLLVVAALLIVAGLLIRRSQTERVNQGTPVARPIPPGAGSPTTLQSPPGP